MDYFSSWSPDVCALAGHPSHSSNKVADPGSPARPGAPLVPPTIGVSENPSPHAPCTFYLSEVGGFRNHLGILEPWTNALFFVQQRAFCATKY